VARILTATCDDLRKKLAVLRQQESNPQGVAWAEVKSLLDVAKDKPSRLRLRELLRTVISEFRACIVRRTSHRFMAVQLHFAAGTTREYLIWYRSGTRGRGGQWLASSLPRELGKAGLDLRRARDAANLRKALEDLDVEALLKAMAVGAKPAR
jgi:hypothetical protein